jgi:hypothetical protein
MTERCRMKKWPGEGNAIIGWLDEECGECRGTGAEEYIQGFARPCDACHGTGLAQVGTHPKGGDAKQAPGASLSDAVAEGHAPNLDHPIPPQGEE